MAPAAAAPPPPFDSLQPPRPGGMASGAVLSLLVHGGLVAALALAVNWRMQAPDAVSAELWAAVPQLAAPAQARAAAPPPVPDPAPKPAVVAPSPAPPPVRAQPAPKPAPAPPVEPSIATARAEQQQQRRNAERQQQQQQQAADEARARAATALKQQQQHLQQQQQREQQAKQDARQAAKQAQAAADQQRAAEARKADDARTEALRQQQLSRMLGALPSASSPAIGSAAVSSTLSQSYAGRLKARIGKPTSLFPETLVGNPAAEVEVTAGATGTIIARRLTKSSGNKEWDDAVLRQIDRAGSLPPDTDGRVPSPITMTFRPKE